MNFVAYHTLLPIKETTEDVLPTTRYSLGMNVYARSYRPGYDHWIEGIVTSRHGKVVYDVSVWIRHRNQLRQRTGINNSESISLLGTFEISTPSIFAKCNDPPVTADHTLLPKR